LVLFLSLIQTSQARADLHFAKTEIDAGEVRGGMPAPQRFAFVNDGAGTVEITGLHVSCGCLKPMLEPRVYKPGQKGELILHINPLVQSAGKHAWTAQIAYRAGGELKEQTLKVFGTIIAEVAVQPAALTVFAEHAGNHSLVLTELRAKPLRLTSVQTTSPFLHVKCSEVKKNERGHWERTITLEPDKDLPDGRHDEQLEMMSDDPEYRVMRVAVTVVKRPKKRLTAVPDPVRLEGSASRLIVIRDSEDLPVVIDEVTADSQELVCVWAKGENKGATVNVRVDPKNTAGSGDPRGAQNTAGSGDPRQAQNTRRAQESAFTSAIHVHVSKPISTIMTIPVNVVEY
jgi:hypothetical protein